ncbi:MAG: hypothetical protein P4L67_03415 [Candidatus Pacebacteria bacterium]|nr:hypothetical protein [Candidatus Paceibacterota bacterium]
MKKELKEQGSPSAEEVNTCSIVEQVDKIELIDTFETVETKELVTLPYLNGLYQNLILRSDAPDKGIPRVVLIDVNSSRDSLSFSTCRA